MREYIIIGILVSIGLFLANWGIARRESYIEKETAYECGYDPKELPRGTFEVEFYVVGLLFLLFDLEITYVLPWGIVYKEVGFGGLIVGMAFIIIITIGYLYEWSEGEIEWY